jgi:dTDP-4-dehydrorhamnose 3,5-epimerase
MEIVATKLKGVKLIKPDVFEDHRGEYLEIYNEDVYRQKGIDVRFVQDDISMSSLHVLRGIHCDKKCWKLVSCLMGRFYLVIVDTDRSQATFGQWQSFLLSERNHHQVLIPPMHGVAHLALAERIIFHYKQSENYDPARQLTFTWNDPAFKIWWPVKNPILSMRDEVGHYVDL